MFSWYEAAVCCFVFLDDVSVRSDLPAFETLRWSSWFKRGWTLQELLAPRSVTFCDTDWTILGNIDVPPTTGVWDTSEFGPCLSRPVSEITGIPTVYLETRSYAKALSNACVAQKLSWAARRRTTRVEDEAYCLLGLLGVNMPLLYGEGKRAFLRLQEEIIRRSPDQSTFAWSTDRAIGFDTGRSPVYEAYDPLLAPALRNFRRSGRVEVPPWEEALPYASYTFSNRGIHITAQAVRYAPKAAPHQRLKVEGVVIATSIYVLPMDVWVTEPSGVDTDNDRFVDGCDDCLRTGEVKIALAPFFSDRDLYYRLALNELANDLEDQLSLLEYEKYEPAEKSFLVIASHV